MGSMASLSRFAFGLAIVAGAALFYMMAITVLDIIGRNFGLFTIASGIEQTELLMVAVTFLALPLCVSVEGNIVVDVATSYLPARVNRLIDAFWDVVAALVLALLAYLAIRNGLVSLESGQRTELLGLSPLVAHVVAAFGMISAIVVALGVAMAVVRRSGAAAAE